MEKSAQKAQQRVARHRRIRAKVTGSAARPRLTIFRSNQYIYAQLINDEAGTTIAAADSRKEKGVNATERAKAVGSTIAKKAKDAKIDTVVFDRGGYRYQGSIAALADAAREGGLKF